MPYSIYTFKDQPRRHERIEGKEMSKLRKHVSFAAIAATVLLSVGCSSGTQEEAAFENLAPPANTAPVAQAPLPATDDKKAKEHEESGKQAEENKNNISLASPEVEEIRPVDPAKLLGGEAEASDPDSTGNIRKNPEDYDVSAPFNPETPTLMGLAIGTDALVVLEHFGEPHNIYELPEDLENARVFTYPGFSIGIQDGKVLFVEVNTSSVNPGLNGFRLGYTREEAILYLGEPTASSEFVLNYISNGSVLKLDTDPETDRIHSIKLFADE